MYCMTNTCPRRPTRIWLGVRITGENVQTHNEHKCYRYYSEHLTCIYTRTRVFVIICCRRNLNTHSGIFSHTAREVSVCGNVECAPIIMFILTPTTSKERARFAHRPKFRHVRCTARFIREIYVYISCLPGANTHKHAVSECIHSSLIVRGHISLDMFVAVCVRFSGGLLTRRAQTKYVCACLTKSLFGLSSGGNCWAQPSTYRPRFL